MAKKKRLSDEAKARKYYLDYLIMLVAVGIPCVYYRGPRCLSVLAAAIITAFVCDLAGGIFFYNKLTVSDLSAIFTGAAIAFMLPSTVPLYIPVIGAAFAVIVCRIPFGTALTTPCVPAAAGFAFITVCFPDKVFAYEAASINTTGLFISNQSISAMLASNKSLHLDLIGAFDILTGAVTSAMGTGCATVLLGCAAYLLIRRSDAFLNFAGFVISCSVGAILFPRVNTGRFSSLVLELAAGSLLFAAAFFITDPALTAKRPVYRLVYGLYAGTLVMLMRHIGPYEDSVCFAIVLAGASWPLLESILEHFVLRREKKAARRKKTSARKEAAH